MRYALGIDTGGTYTDAVIYELETGEILESAKFETDKENLLRSIEGVLSGLKMLKGADFIALSTTLATNACVEGKGGGAKLILIGADEEIVRRYGRDYGLPDAGDILFIPGRLSSGGQVEEPADWDLLRRAVRGLKDTQVFAVVSQWGVRNPVFERQARDILSDEFNKQTVCGFELTGELNYIRRGASALLNARLIPLIDHFLKSVKMAVSRRGLEAPIVIVRSDGSLMNERFTRVRPVETLLCGPVASVLGGTELTGEKDCVVIDMGGTTTDIAIVKNGMPRIAAEGVSIGGWRTNVKSIDVSTVGLGGDSRIYMDESASLRLSSKRVAPLCYLACRWPETRAEMERILASDQKSSVDLMEFYYSLRTLTQAGLTEMEARIMRALEPGPLSLNQLALKLGVSIYEVDVKRLEKLDAVMRSALTPTDIMHVRGDYGAWDAEAALCGAEHMARRLELSVEALCQRVYEEIGHKLYRAILNALLGYEGIDVKEENHALSALMDMGFKEPSDGILKCAYTSAVKLVGIGAPTGLFLPDVAKKLHSLAVIPKSAAVANAVGAAVGNICAEKSILIKPVDAPEGVTGYTVFGVSGPMWFEDYDDAVKAATEQAKSAAEGEIRTRGASGSVATQVDVDKKTALIAFMGKNQDESTMHLETVVTARSVGKFQFSSASAT